MPRIITVFGATGKQGGSVVSALLADGTFTPRAATRNPDSEASKKLKDRGAEIVQADLSDKESIKKAIAGSEGVFGVTLFDQRSPEIEIVQGKNLVDACKEVGIQILVWSSLPSATKVSKGKYLHVSTYDNKSSIDDYLKASGIPYAILHTGGFAENIWNMQLLTKVDTLSGPSYVLTIPRSTPTSTQTLTWITKDIGQCALALFKNYQDRPSEILGQTFVVAGQTLTNEDLIKILEKALGRPVTFQTFESTGVTMIDEMFDFSHEFGYRDSIIPDPRLVALGVKFGTMEQFAEEEVKPRFI